MLKNFFSFVFFSALTCYSVNAQVVISIDSKDRGPKISDTHYGIFYEDINHAADGGIYAELIRNRSFEDGRRFGAPADMQFWHAESPNGGTIQAKLIKPGQSVKLLNDVQENAMELNINAKNNPVYLFNDGFWGINAVQGRTYKLSFWAKGKFNGTIKAMICDKDVETIYAQTVINVTIGTEWKKYTATMKADKNNPKALFALAFQGEGVLDLDVVSLFPPTFKNRENGLRPDLANMLYQMHPKFMRFPGGCFVEGQESPDNAFRWERTIGPIENRPGHWNVNWGYRTTDGLGFHEYLQLAEDLGAKPLYVVNVGIWHGGNTPLNELQPWIDETLAALEYANGDVNTKYGAMRAANGHPKPFNIEYLEIGNENNQPDERQQSDRYYQRFKMFKEQILKKYPNIHLIGNVAAWGTDNPTWDSNETVELVDEHYYRTPGWFTNNFHKYDSYDRNGPLVYVGEYAVTNGFGNLGNMNAALGEAIFMMGTENNSDIVPLNSYAPIFVNENDAKWKPDMIRFNSSKVMGTPSYYVQMMMPQNLGKQVVKVNQVNPYDNAKFKQVTPNKSRVGFATWNTRASFIKPESFTNDGNPEFVSGRWNVGSDGVVSQVSNREQCVAVCNTLVNDHYTMKFKARKDGGQEGFIIVFNYVDQNNYAWINFGGWGNTQHGIEQVSGTGKSQTETKPGKIETGKWYDVTLQVDGDNVKAWLDDELVFDTKLKHDTSVGIFSSATIDDEEKELIVKIVNTGDEATTADIQLNNFIANSAKVIRLASESGNDENTLQQPTNIHPVEQLLSPQSDNSVIVDIPPYSLNIIRIKQ